MTEQSSAAYDDVRNSKVPPRRSWLRRLFDDPCCIGGEMAQCAGCGDFEACDVHHECPGGGWL
jgi:hypothetical protein